MTKIMKNLEKVRQTLDLNQEDMGKLLGVRRETYNNWKREKYYPNSDNFEKIYGLFKIVERLDLGIWEDDWTEEKITEILDRDMIAKIKEKAPEDLLEKLEEGKE